MKTDLPPDMEADPEGYVLWEREQLSKIPSPAPVPGRFGGTRDRGLGIYTFMSKVQSLPEGAELTDEAKEFVQSISKFKQSWPSIVEEVLGTVSEIEERGLSPEAKTLMRVIDNRYHPDDFEDVLSRKSIAFNPLTGKRILTYELDALPGESLDDFKARTKEYEGSEQEAIERNNQDQAMKLQAFDMPKIHEALRETAERMNGEEE